MTEPGNSPVSPTDSTRTFRSIWPTMISRCLSSISTPWRPVNVLDLTQQVPLHGLFAGDPQDVVRHQRPFDQSVAGPNPVAGVNPQVLAMRNLVLALDAAFVLDDDGPLAAALLVQQLDAAGDLGHHRRLLRPAGLEDLGHARQTAGDVLRAAAFARRLGQERAGRILLPSSTSILARSGM